MSQPTRPAALIFIFITVLVDVIGLGIIIPVLPSLIMELSGEGLSAASRYGGWLMFSYASVQFLAAPVIGGLSDQFGRRPVLLASLLGFGLDYVLQGLAPTIGWLFIGRILAGITGASFTTASAYIADISAPEKRAQNFGLIGAAFGLGFIIGPVIGGVLGQFGPRVPFFAAAAITLLNCLYGYFVIPESLSVENRRPFSWKRANPLGTLMQLRQYPVIVSLVGVLVFIYIAGHATQSTWAYYTMEKFSWNEAAVGYSLGFVGLIVALVQGGLTRVVIPRIGQIRSVYIGLLLYTVGFLGFAFAGAGWVMYAVMIPYGLAGIAGPALQGIMSNQVPNNSQGELQGALTSLVSLTSIVGPPLMTNLFAHFTRHDTDLYFPGMPFLAGAILTFIALLWAIRSLQKIA
ncbi:TCR/Tet family MFS transporter [Flavilitoribacter nigricans]|uniref:Tetracycline resistance MFS efflux pump n=1 Tax=Flavilitoribacter nigricans (strain ATCC 23147 / DSM 23189 / NBRC 102662 / NCIMB 1420 / SS-2) TaxID=1122177 RepID=A0A2D0MY39_FLAN2|nr:TCR/Tet family MFS transporter [Flavilitoribacter nigricans]PHN01192.1 tetracycline resistance MFS efflux pump [Flavilitoribacter nigricans DSM 23189 = NBRC 102662]